MLLLSSSLPCGLNWLGGFLRYDFGICEWSSNSGDADPGLQCGHDPLRFEIIVNNRKPHLRIVTYSQNSLNRPYKKRPDSPSKYKGVTWHKPQRKWAVQICYNNIHKNVGYFHDEIEAAKAYDAAARKYHKDFAVLNFPNNQ